MKGVTTHFKQALLTVLIALVATLVVVCNQASPSGGGLALDEAPMQERGQVFTVQPIDFLFAPMRQSEPSSAPPASLISLRSCFVGDSSDLLSYLLVGSGKESGGMNAKIECVN